MSRFKNIERLVATPKNKIAEVRGIGKSKANKIYKLFHTTKKVRP